MVFKKLTPEEKQKRKEERKKIKYEREHKIINGIDHKICAKCGEYKPAILDYFYKNDKNSIDQLSNKCIECERKRAIKWKKNNPEKYAVSQARVEVKPERILSNRKRAEKQRKAGKQKIWLKNNPEKQKQYTLNHRNHDISEAEWQACLKFFDYKCVYCGMPLSEHLAKHKQKLHKEHADHNGYNDVRNCVPACRSCNYRKWAFPLEEWYKEQDFFSENKLTKIYQWINEEYKKYIEDKPPYRITRKQNEDKYTYHWEVWSVDEKRNFVECIAKRNKKREIINDIQNGIIKIKID